MDIVKKFNPDSRRVFLGFAVGGTKLSVQDVGRLIAAAAEDLPGRLYTDFEGVSQSGIHLGIEFPLSVGEFPSKHVYLYCNLADPS